MIICKYIITFVLVLGFSLPVQARDKVRLPVSKTLSLECIIEASQKHGVPLAALLGILSVEGGRVGEALSNTNGTWDMGPFQINTCHSNLLESKGMSPKDILTNGCANSHFAAWLLQYHVKQRGDIWSAIAAYHSVTPHLGQAYLQRVQAHILRLQKQGVSELLALHKDGGS